MNQLLLLTIIILQLQLCLSVTCYTNYCKQRYNLNGNARYQFFDLRTFGDDIHPNPTGIIRNNNDFRKYIKDNVQCTGMYCVEKQYKCSSRGDKNCYHVEHMYDKNGKDPLIPSKCKPCKDIPGNMVMAAGTWNAALGGVARGNYQANIAEKTEIYGQLAMSKALNNIMNCCRNNFGVDHPSTIVPEKLFDSNDTSYDSSCDDDSPCNCDSDADCGCDCDFDDADSIINGLDAIMAFSFVFGSLILLFVIGISICVVCLYYKIKTAIKQPTNHPLIEKYVNLTNQPSNHPLIEINTKSAENKGSVISAGLGHSDENMHTNPFQINL